MGFRETVVRTKMHCAGNLSSGCRRTDDFALPKVRNFQFYAHFKVDLIVQVNRHMPSGALDLLVAKAVPHRATGFWNDFGEVRRSRPTAHKCQWSAVDFLNLDIVVHEHQFYQLALIMINVSNRRLSCGPIHAACDLRFRGAFNWYRNIDFNWLNTACLA